MITKRKIKNLENAMHNLRGDKLFHVTKKYDEEIYYYKGKIYNNLVYVEKDIDFQLGDVLIVVIDYKVE